MKIAFSGILPPWFGHCNRQLLLVMTSREAGSHRTIKKLLFAMKLTGILLLATCLQVSAIGTAQRVTLSLKDADLGKIFTEVIRQTGVSIVYNEDIIKQAKPVTIEVADESVEKVLELCLKNQPFRFISKGKYYSVEPTQGLNPGLQEHHFSDALPPPVTGIIRDAEGNPIAGVNIVVKGTQKGTTTDEEGRFSIEAKTGDVLLVSSVNYENKEIEINKEVEIVIALKIKQTDLAEVNIITSTGFQTLPKERTTGSFVQIDNKLLNRRVSTNILSRLEGITSGLLFDNKSENQLGISIRGRSTIFANTQPLVILDNFPFEGNLQDLNPNDIESITVLRDAAAASIWGAFSGNGVIVLTSKKGKTNQPLKLELNTNLTISDKPDLFYDPNFLPANEFIELEKYLFDQGFYNNDLANSSYPVVSPVVNTLNQLKNGTIDQAQADALLNKLKTYDIRSDYSKYLYQKAITQQYTLSLSGGGNKSSYYISGNYDKSRANIQMNSSERITLNSQYLFNPIKNLEVTVRYNYSLIKDKNNGINSVTSSGKYSNIYPYARLADDQGNYLPVPTLFGTSFIDNPGVTGLQDWSYIPLKDRMLNNFTSKSVSNRIYGAMKYHFTKTLNAEISYQYQENNVT
ncbi:MAG: carboxypeptidase-like regulatory domain-containing protein, partial [Chitinophagaceae bacterium]|nr:carboxypeptidase-like regulatory domain-containing protein [Chitinophagaceae bacterium]